MNILIVEDEQLAAERLREMILIVRPDYSIEKETSSIHTTCDYLASAPDIDLIFMDIHLSDGPCFEIMSRMEVTTPIIFTTAYDQYALEAFQAVSIDYLLKPIHTKNLRKAIEKFELVLKSFDQSQQVAKQGAINTVSRQLLNNSSYQKRFLVQKGQQLIPVGTDQIAWFYAEGKYVYLVSRGSGKSFLIEHTLDELEKELLDPSLFYRINRKIIINKESVSLASRYPSSRLLITPDTVTTKDMEMVVSRNRVEGFKSWLTL